MVRLKWSSIFLISSAVLALAGGLGLFVVSTSLISQPRLKPVRIAVPTSLASGLIYLAKDSGYFEHENLAVELKPRAVGREALRELFDGEAELAVAYETPIVLAKIRGLSPVVLTELYSSSGLYKIVSSKSAGIRDFNDLKGKRIGLPLGTTYQFLLELYLSTHSIPRDSVRLFNLNPREMEAALTSGDVDAVAAVEPDLLNLLESGTGEFRSIPIDLHTQICVLLTRADRLSDDAELISGVMKGIRRAERLFQADPLSARKRIFELLELPNERLSDFAWGKVSFHMGLSSLLMTIMNMELDWAAKSAEHPIANPPEAETMVDASFMNRIAPELVTFQ